MGYIFARPYDAERGGALHDKANLAAHLNNIGSGKLNALNVYVTGVRNIQRLIIRRMVVFPHPLGQRKCTVRRY